MARPASAEPVSSWEGLIESGSGELLRLARETSLEPVPAEVSKVKAGPRAAEEKLILVTGFEPFDGLAGNASSDVAHHLDGMQFKVGEEVYRVEGIVLPVDHEEAGRGVSDALKYRNPAAVLMFGISDHAKELCLESKACNACPADSGGCRCKGCGHSCAPHAGSYYSNAPLRKLIKGLAKEKVPAQVSDNAGRFVCNASYYHALKTAHDLESEALVAFIHIPPASEHLTKEQRAWYPSAALKDILAWSESLLSEVGESLSQGKTGRVFSSDDEF